MHNYQKELNSRLASGQLRPVAGKVTTVAVYHDSWCGVNSNRECNCDPDIKIESLQAPTNAAPSVDLPELSDDDRIIVLCRTLVEEGRKRGIHGPVGILNTEVFEFGRDLQARIAARFPNHGVGVAMEVMAPVALEEMELAIERFWSRPHTIESAVALQKATDGKN